MAALDGDAHTVWGTSDARRLNIRASLREAPSGRLSASSGAGSLASATP